MNQKQRKFQFSLVSPDGCMSIWTAISKSRLSFNTHSAIVFLLYIYTVSNICDINCTSATQSSPKLQVIEELNHSLNNISNTNNNHSLVRNTRSPRSSSMSRSRSIPLSRSPPAPKIPNIRSGAAIGMGAIASSVIATPVINSRFRATEYADRVAIPPSKHIQISSSTEGLPNPDSADDYDSESSSSTNSTSLSNSNNDEDQQQTFEAQGSPKIIESIPETINGRLSKNNIKEDQSLLGQSKDTTRKNTSKQQPIQETDDQNQDQEYEITKSQTTRGKKPRQKSQQNRQKQQLDNDDTTTKPEESDSEVEEDQDEEYDKSARSQSKASSYNSSNTQKFPSQKIPNTATNPLKMGANLIKKPFSLLIKPKNESACTPEAYLEFPNDLIGNKWRARGLVVIHIAVVCYMFYSLALVCEKYFIPSLEEFATRLNLSQDVAGATLMSAGSSAPELFTAILGVFIAKGDVGTGTIVGSAVFNILFVIGVSAFVSTTASQLNWWPVLRDSVYYTITVLALIVIIYDERVTAFESAFMISLYALYIVIMSYNDQLRILVTKIILSNPNTAKLISSLSNQASGSDDVFTSIDIGLSVRGNDSDKDNSEERVEEDKMFLSACLVIIQHKRLFRSKIRFQAATRYIIVERQHRIEAATRRQRAARMKKTEQVNYFGPENEPLTSKTGTGQKQRMQAYAKGAALSKNKFSIVSRDDYEFWNRPPEEGENYYVWAAKIPVNYVLHYTIPDCVIYPDKYIIAFFMSILWTAFFSYINVWMVTLIGYTLGIPDSIMGFTFLAAGTSVPDCYSSIHAAKNGMADMAVSNSIGSNVFDILIGLAVPWFIQSALYPGVTATINSRGIVYSVILLFLSLIVTIYLMNKYEWSLKPRLGLALLIAYALFIILTCMLEFNLFGYVNPPPCVVT